ncbi:MAG: ABC transporter substrate-binding protein [Ruminococcaceae bacterium]|nr:ABC transporter substrate-binding protein [Oscillospiraceae bacterium]
MRKRLFLLLLALCLLPLPACRGEEPPIGGAPPSQDRLEGAILTDALGNSHFVERGARVVSCHAAFADCWLLAGGTLVGVTEDAADYGLATEGLFIVGTAHAVDRERLLAASPDYVILSADVTAHLALSETLTALRIPHGLFRVDSFADYKTLMTGFCTVTGRSDLFAQNVTAPESHIAELKASIPSTAPKTVLLMRAHANSIKAKRADNVAGLILQELGLRNIADDVPSLLEELSAEAIIQADPDYIFVLTMGSEEGARAYLAANVESNPAFAGLSAVREGRYRVLPKALFHYKPNEKWDESYAYLYEIIFA